MNVFSHARARRLLHALPAELSAPEQADLAGHLAGCSECREYAGYLKTLQPALALAMHTRWDSRRSSSAASRPIQQRWEERKMILQAIKLTALVVGFALVVVLFLYGPGLLSSLIQRLNINPVAPWVTGVPSLEDPTATEPPLAPTPTLQSTPMSCGSLAEPLCSVEQAEARAGFDIYAPTSLPDGITFTGAIAEPGKSSTLVYTCGDECQLTIFQNKEWDWVRKPEGEGVIVGNYWGTYAVDVPTSETRATRQTGEPATADQVLQFSANSPIQGSPFGIRISVFGSPASSSHLDRIGLIELAYHTIGIPFPSGLIAFETDRDGNQEIYAGEFFDLIPTNLTNHPAEDHSFAWSPDGERIAFLSDRTEALEVFVMQADGSDVHQLTEDSKVSWIGPPAWSPDGERLALTGAAPAFGEGASLIYLVRTDSSGYSMLSYSPDSDGPIYTTQPLQWTPDGKWIAFTENFIQQRRDNLFSITDDSGLMAISVDDGRRIKLSGPENKIVGSFDWSPDGQKVAYAWMRGMPKSYNISVADANGSNLQTILSDPTATGLPPSELAWSPDGTHLVFKPNGGISVVDSREGKIIVNFGETPSGLSRFSWSPNGRLLLFLIDSETVRPRHEIIAIVLGENFSGDRSLHFEEFTGLEFSRPNGADNTNPQWQPRP